MKDVIIALDFPKKADTLSFLSQFTSRKPFVKIGMELFYGEGPDIVRAIRNMGHPVFLDLKLHDIPNTVGRAMTNLARLDVNMVNVHAAGTRAMMQAAREGLSAGGGDAIKLIAVTQLTSTSEVAMREELLIDKAVGETVAAYAKNTQAAGLDGVVCSPLEAKLIKEACGASFLAVTPGIRYPEGDIGDQSRVTTPQKAREIGSDYIVVGRPITAAKDPVAEYARIAKDFMGEDIK